MPELFFSRLAALQSRFFFKLAILQNFSPKTVDKDWDNFKIKTAKLRLAKLLTICLKNKQL